MKVERFSEEKYGLKGNPFLDDIAREEWLKTWVNREEQLEEWTKIISNAISSTKNYIAFVIGDYGRGKSLSLLKIIDESKKHKEILPVYLNFKGEEKSKPGLDFMFRIFKSINFDDTRKDNKKNDLENAIESLPDDLDEAKTILKKIYFGEEERKLALYFLRGELKPTQSQLKKLEVLRKIDSVDIAKEYLSGFLGFIKKLGYSTLLLAVDEFEYLFSLVPKTQQSIYLALLRGLYDFPLGVSKKVNDIANMAFFIATSESSGWYRLEEMVKKEASTGGPIEPLLDRVDAKTILGVFDKKQTRKLIERRLSYNRIKGKYGDKPLIPFTDDFVEFIHEKTGGLPRAIIVRCGHVLDVGLAERISLLDKEFARKALEERGF